MHAATEPPVASAATRDAHRRSIVENRAFPLVRPPCGPGKFADKELRAQEWPYGVGYAVGTVVLLLAVLGVRYFIHDATWSHANPTKKPVLPVGKTIDVILGFCVVVSIWGIIDYVVEMVVHSEDRWTSVKISLGYSVATAAFFSLWMVRRYVFKTKLLLRDSFAMFQ
ncbi:MAG: uncharacterized protein KVP18_003809 [Porospora cf. gigantea A]|uniref:uncharacterized protein n=1 Tax=Porospora cf. gigantea A TaxID=2853593 RepID=UPI0035594088|nr:MAG: hypothetical protein KVP18_003809 [Porospora cf. gigantea A]